MGAELDAAFSHRAWAVSGLLFDLVSSFDDEGRPLGERRAPSGAKRNVPIELVPCPYEDERHGMPMNQSALEQVKRHFSAALEHLERFHALSGPVPQGGPHWTDVLATVLDSLFSPARFLLGARSASVRVPAALAVSHKLAAGYFGVVRQLLVEEALGVPHPVTPEHLLEFVRQRRALIGDREVCAGPPKLIARATQVLVQGATADSPSSSFAPERPVAPSTPVWVARTLARQICLGIAWELYDRCAEAHWFRTFFDPGALEPKTAFLRGRLAQSKQELSERLTGASLEAAARAVPRDFAEAKRTALLEAFRPGDGDESADEARLRSRLSALEPTPVSGFLQLGPTVRAQLGAASARYLTAYGRLVAAQHTLESELRRALDLATEAPLRLGGWLLPTTHTLGWLQMALGYTLECTPGPLPELTLCHRAERVQVGAQG